jgi:predicted nucleic acid-binding protein
MLTRSEPTSTQSQIRIRSAVSGEQRLGGLIDTSIVVHLAALNSAELPDEMVISTITLAELSAGPHHADDPAERARRVSVLQHAESTFEPLPVDTDAARSFGLISAAVLAAGRTTRRRVTSLMIASVALARRLPLHTTNPDDFAGLSDLVTVVPVERPIPAGDAEAQVPEPT